MDDLNALRNKFDSQQRDILTSVWRYYLKNGKWIPSRLLHTTHGDKKNVRPVLEQFGGSIVYEQEETTNLYYGLTFLGLLVSSEGEYIEELLANYLRIARILALKEPTRTHVSSEEALTRLRLGPAGVMELGRALFLSPFNSGGSFSTTEWNAGLPKDIEDLPNDLQTYVCERAIEQYDSDIPVAFSERQVYRKSKGRSKVSSRADERAPDGYVDQTRIDQLIAVSSQDYDLTRLIELCRELNDCYSNGNYLAVAMLTRALLDHVPPIFGMNNFSEVANNYQSSQSFKDSMQHLDNSCRRIADAHLHVQIRPKEVLPSRIQVNFANDVDVLLAEIVRILA